jgi:phosphoserine phosphatase
MAGRPLIVFDVNETLLDLQTMEPIFERIFGERQAMRLWFANFIMYRQADRRRLLRPVHRYRRGGHEDAGGYVRYQHLRW